MTFSPDNPTTCDRERLRRSLADELSDRQESELARHLEDCAFCRRELEIFAAREGEWSQVSNALRHEADSIARSRLAGDDDRFTDLDDAAAPFADFAVDFLEPSSAPDAIGRLGEIEIRETIGRGGMGMVLKGLQPELKRVVAVKVLAPHLATSGAARRRFAREAQAAAAIVHPHVMPIFTVQSTGKLPFLVMPFVACESLQQRISRDGPLETVDILRIGVQTAGALAAAHAQGLVHRDVKPANILLEKGVDRVLLTDFGLARAVDDASITRTGIIAGTPQFMSPEQARGEAVDARSDLFSLGSVLYTMAAGRPPFRAESTFAILRRITDTQPRGLREINSQVPPWLEAIVDKLLAKEPSDRFDSADDVAQILEQCLAHVQQPTNVALPAAVSELAEQADVSRTGAAGTSGGATGGLPASASVSAESDSQGMSNQYPKWKTAAIFIVGLTALAGLWLAAARNWPPTNRIPSASGTTLQLSAGEHPESVAPVVSDADTTWDSLVDDVQRLGRDTEQLELRANEPWDKRSESPASGGRQPPESDKGRAGE